MARTRSEYRLTPLPASSTPSTPLKGCIARAPEDADREQLATAILDAYRGTVDDEGEDDEAALSAVDDWLSRLEHPHSVVLEQDGHILAVSFVVDVAGRKYIDPVATVARRKREGLGRTAVWHSLGSLRDHGVHEVGAVITDGNVASERLFTDLGFVRVGAWD
ncbi:MAG: GNAT family N-acetyltransferase [Acidimicrobiia bacterium]